MAELQAPVQLFSWRKLEELEVVTHAMHHGMMRRIVKGWISKIQWPSANPATVPWLDSRFLCTRLAFLNQCGLANFKISKSRCLGRWVICLAVWLGGAFLVDSLLLISYSAWGTPSAEK